MYCTYPGGAVSYRKLRKVIMEGRPAGAKVKKLKSFTAPQLCDILGAQESSHFQGSRPDVNWRNFSEMKKTKPLLITRKPLAEAKCETQCWKTRLERIAAVRLSSHFLGRLSFTWLCWLESNFKEHISMDAPHNPPIMHLLIHGCTSVVNISNVQMRSDADVQRSYTFPLWGFFTLFNRSNNLGKRKRGGKKNKKKRVWYKWVRLHWFDRMSSTAKCNKTQF